MTDVHSPAPSPTFHLIPSRFPPIGLLDTVATAADMAAVMELAGWTNDRLVQERLRRLPVSGWVYGRANSSVVMASFLHAAPSGARFNGPDLGAWYAAAALPTAAFEVAHHLRREGAVTGKATVRRDYRTYVADLAGSYLDIRGQQASRADVYDPTSYAAAQRLGQRCLVVGRPAYLALRGPVLPQHTARLAFGHTKFRRDVLHGGPTTRSAR